MNIEESSLFYRNEKEKNLIAVFLLESIRDRHEIIRQYTVDKWERRSLFIDIKGEVNDKGETSGLNFVTSKLIVG